MAGYVIHFLLSTHFAWLSGLFWANNGCFWAKTVQIWKGICHFPQAATSHQLVGGPSSGLGKGVCQCRR